MTQREVITEAMLQAAIAALDKRIAMPPLPAERKIFAQRSICKAARKGQGSTRCRTHSRNGAR